ncbi:TPA: low affinity immunoglobulin gamma Fc region receptor III isoform 2 [Bos taurus]|nr:TPA: low affinity immunoglobulin gamma Fc region receptor III isoform 2 [Bos taurus]
MWQLLPPAALLLLVSADTQTADPSKAVVLLDPQWNHVLTNDRVTLKCQGDYPVEDNSTKWWHNGTLISSQTPSYFHIPEAKLEHSGSYFCRGIIGSKNESSESVQITVQAPETLQTVSSFFLPWHQITFCLVMGVLFAVDTGLYFSVRRHLQSSEEWRDGKVTWSKGP